MAGYPAPKMQLSAAPPAPLQLIIPRSEHAQPQLQQLPSLQGMQRARRNAPLEPVRLSVCTPTPARHVPTRRLKWR